MERTSSMSLRQRTTSEGETAEEHHDTPTLPSSISRLKHPKSPKDPPEDEPLPDTSTDAKRKGYKKPKLKSFGSFMHKVVKTMSLVALGPKGRRSQFQQMENEPDPPVATVTDKNNVNCYYGNRIPGVEGLRNHGNTCFINSVIQCLSHTDILAEYFVTDQYKNDMDRSDKTNAKKFGTKGEVTEHLATLLKSLWSRQYSPEISNEFKTVVGKHGSQYRGYMMHDAQEFLMWLLDKVHEDLNTTAKKKYRANKSNIGRSDDMIAAEALANHMRNNNSFVHDLFQALLRSSLVCPRCKQQSNTFDPFICVSLPIPQKAFRPIYVTVVYFNSHPKQVRIGLTMDTLDRVKELRQKLADDTKIPARQLILAEIYFDGFHRSFVDEQPLTDIHETDSVYAIEVPKPYIETLPSNQYPENDYIMLLVLHTEGLLQGKRFGPPVVIQIPRDMKFLEIQEIILRSVEKQMRPTVTPPHKPGNALMKLRVHDGTSDKVYLPTDSDHLPLYMETVERALAIHAEEGGPSYIRLVVEWEPQAKSRIIGDVQDVIEEHASVKQIKASQQQPVVSTLDECFHDYTQEEELEAEDAWMCPTCRRRQQGTTKKLTLWSLPDILVIHLKRFKQIGPRRTKLNNLISFPLTGLDMAQHVVTRTHDSQLLNMYMTLSPWRRQRLSAPRDDDYVYDLYAVCNHYGNMQGGHYTAFCQSPVNGQWYSFDDAKVTPLTEDQIQTRAAYMLFYQRRTLTTISSNSSGSSASSQGSDHWVNRIRPFNYSPSVKNISHSEENLLEESQKSEEPDANDPQSRTTLRTIESYGTLGRSKASTTPRGASRSHTFNTKWKPSLMKKSLDISAVSPKILRKTISKLRSPTFSPENKRKAAESPDQGKKYSQHALLVTEQYKKLEDGPVLKPPPPPGEVSIPYKESFRTLDGIRSPNARSPVSSRGSDSPEEAGTPSDDCDCLVQGELPVTELPEDYTYITETCV